MKYYLMRLPSDPKIIGVRDGAAQVEITEDFHPDKEINDEVYRFFHGMDHTDYVNNFNLSVKDFRIDAKPLKRAKITDFISFTPYFRWAPFIVSERVLEVFSGFHIQKHFLYPVNISMNKLDNHPPFYLFCLGSIGDAVIDFPNSVFYTGTEILGKKFIHFQSRDEHLKFLKEQNPLTGIEKIVMNRLFDRSLDFFVIKARMFVSERLREAIIENRFTGVSLFDDKAPAVVVPD